MMEYPYVVYNPSGVAMMSAVESCRYPSRIEMSILDAGYTIKLHGKRITKADIRKRGNQK